jgi:hypothetical protein
LPSALDTLAGSSAICCLLKHHHAAQCASQHPHHAPRRERQEGASWLRSSGDVHELVVLHMHMGYLRALSLSSVSW